jgi:hypothetical protein
VRTAARLGHDARVSSVLGLDLHLDLDVADPALPIAGRLSRGGGEIASFSGWMQLTTVLRQAIDEGAAAATTQREGA